MKENILQFFSETSVWPLPLTLLAAVALITWKHRSSRLGIYLITVASLGTAARAAYIFLCRGAVSSRYFLPQYWLFLLCACTGVSYLCVKPRDKRIRIFLAWVFILGIGTSFAGKIILHVSKSIRKDFTPISAIVKSEMEAKNPVSAGFICDKFDARIELPPGVVLYDLRQSPPGGKTSMIEQAAFNHELLFILIKRNTNQSDLRRMIFETLEQTGQCTIRELGNPKKPIFYGTLYGAHCQPPSPESLGEPLLDSQIFFKTFTQLSFPEAKLRRLAERRMSPDQYKDFLLPAHWNIDETFCWMPQCFPARSFIASGAEGTFWQISSMQKISIVCSDTLNYESPRLLLSVDAEGLSDDAEFQPAVVDGSGYSVNIPLAVKKRQKYHFILDLPAKPASARLGILTGGTVRIYDLKLYQYGNRQETNFHKEQTISGN